LKSFYVLQEIIMTTSVTRPCFTTQHQTCKTKTKTDFLVSDRYCPKTDGLRPHNWIRRFYFVMPVVLVFYAASDILFVMLRLPHIR